MTDKLDHNDHPIDAPSQRILSHLATESEESTSSELRDAAGVEHAQSVTYRINEHLAPAGLVEWAEEDAPGAAGTRRLYSLTSEGREWVVDNRDDLVKPTGLDETANAAQEARETAQRALDEAESAKTSVQNYRTKVARLKTRVLGREDPDYEGYWETEGHEQRIENLENQQQTLTERVNDKAPAEQAASNEVRINDISDDIDKLRDEIDEQADQDDLDELRDEIELIRARVKDIEATQSDLSEWANTIDSRIEDVEQRQSQGLLRRLLPI